MSGRPVQYKNPDCYCSDSLAANTEHGKKKVSINEQHAAANKQWKLITLGPGDNEKDTSNIPPGDDEYTSGLAMPEEREVKGSSEEINKQPLYRR